MNFNLKKPCKDCPFRKDVKPYLHKRRCKEILSALFDQDGTFSCHKKNGYDDDGGAIETRDSEHCAGATILLEKENSPNQLMRIAERLRLYDRRKIDMKAPVYSSRKEMQAAYNAADP